MLADTTAPSNSIVLAAARISDVQAILSPPFALVTPKWNHGVCCQSEFFELMTSRLRKHPAYREDPRDADILIPEIDMLRQCEWPFFEQGSLHGLPYPGCSPGSAEFKPYDVGLAVSRGQYTCDWCCRSGVDEFVDTVTWASFEYGPSKTFVMFRNSQDNYHECHEFKYAKLALSKVPAAVRFVGFQLQMSMLTEPQYPTDRTEYPLRGINLLTPLHPFQEGLVLDDDGRAACDLSGRDLRASFSGHMDPEGVRKRVLQLRDMPGTEGFYIRETKGFHLESEMDYREMMRRSLFAYVPRGDEHYSFRLTEALAAGAVPIVIDDDFVPPYGMASISSWAIRIPENNVPSSVGIINSMPSEQICELVRNGTEMWRKARDLDSMIEAMLEALGRSMVKSTTA